VWTGHAFMHGMLDSSQSRSTSFVLTLNVAMAPTLF
jgi:hypothetical protein